MNDQFSVVIVAGGKGSRFGSSVPKQFLPLGSATVIEITVNQFLSVFPALEVVVVLPEQYLSRANDLFSQYAQNIRLVTGGEERFYSVKKGIDMVSNKSTVIGIHDAVRPLVSREVIKNSFETAQIKGTAVPVIPGKSSLRRLAGEDSQTVSREDFVIVQTPQCFRADVLKKSYTVSYQSGFTDDASVVEYAGYKINLVAGNDENIKITTPPDLQIADQLLKVRENQQ